MEQTLVILKPDTIQRAITGEIISRFERVGLKIVGVKMVNPDRDHYYHHYETISKLGTRRGQKALDVTLDMMTNGPVIALVLEGVGAVDQVRKMSGTTEPKEAVPGTIRGDYAHISFMHANDVEVGVANIVHASGDIDEAKMEIKHWFKKDELFKYKTLHEKFTQPS